MKKKIIVLSLTFFILSSNISHCQINDLEVISNKTNLLINMAIGLNINNKEDVASLKEDIKYLRNFIRTAYRATETKYNEIEIKPEDKLKFAQQLTILDSYLLAVENINMYLLSNNKSYLKNAINISSTADSLKLNL